MKRSLPVLLTSTFQLLKICLHSFKVHSAALSEHCKVPSCTFDVTNLDTPGCQERMKEGAILLFLYATQQQQAVVGAGGEHEGMTSMATGGRAPGAKQTTTSQQAGGSRVQK